MNKPTLRILHTLSRSGGTLLSRCLGCMDNIVLLSEIHPQGLTWNNPLGQANEWFKLFTPQELNEYANSRLTFNQSILLITKKCTEQGKILVIRDWSHLDYFGKPFIPAPTYQPMLVNQLKNNFNLIQTSFVRHPIDQWLSLNNLTIMKNKLTIDEYLKGYQLFSELALKTGFIRYEDFTRDPDQELSALCFWLKIDFDDTYVNKWYDFTHISGDQNRVNKKYREILALKRFGDDQTVLNLFSKNAHYQRAIKNLNYLNA